MVTDYSWRRDPMDPQECSECGGILDENHHCPVQYTDADMLTIAENIGRPPEGEESADDQPPTSDTEEDDQSDEQ